MIVLSRFVENRLQKRAGHESQSICVFAQRWSLPFVALALLMICCYGFLFHFCVGALYIDYKCLTILNFRSGHKTP